MSGQSLFVHNFFLFLIIVISYPIFEGVVVLDYLKSRRLQKMQPAAFVRRRKFVSYDFLTKVLIQRGWARSSENKNKISAHRRTTPQTIAAETGSK